MANPTLANLAAAVTKMVDTAASAKVVLDGIGARIQAAIDAAIANGATAAELAPVQDEADALSASADSLAASIAANSSAGPVV
jgi:hypothetical protein